MLKQFFFLVMVITLSSCTQSYELTKSDKVHIIKNVVKMFDNYHSDIKKEGLTAEFKYLDTSTDFFWVPPEGESALFYDTIRKILEVNAKKFQSIEFDWDTLQVFPLSHKIANYSGIVKGIMVDTSGIKSSILIIESGTLIKRLDGWKLLSGQSANLN